MPTFLTADLRIYSADFAFAVDDMEIPARPSAGHTWDVTTGSWRAPHIDRRYVAQQPMPQPVYQQPQVIVQDRDDDPEPKEDNFMSRISLKSILPIIGIVIPIVVPGATALLKLYNDQTVLRAEFQALKNDSEDSQRRLEIELREIKGQMTQLSATNKKDIDDVRRDLQDILIAVRSGTDAQPSSRARRN